MADQEYERDEQLLEARRLKRLELKRKRMIRKRITLGAIFLVLVVLIIVIFKSCGKKDDQQADPPPTEPENSQQDELPAQTATATLSAVGDIMVYDSQLEDALQSDETYQFLPSFAPISTLLTASDVTVGNFEANLAGPPIPESRISARRSPWPPRWQASALTSCRPPTPTASKTACPGSPAPSTPSEAKGWIPWAPTSLRMTKRRTRLSSRRSTASAWPSWASQRA